jgi:hypothetical protein
MLFMLHLRNLFEQKPIVSCLKIELSSVTKYHYYQVFGQAFNPNNIAAGYQATGIYSFCPAKVVIHLKAVKLDIVKTIQCCSSG